MFLQPSGRFLCIFLRFRGAQEARVESPWEKFLDGNDLRFTLKVAKYDGRILRKLPDNLPASSARRRQGISVGYDREFCEVPLTFRQGLPDGDALGANGQSVTGAFNIAADVDFSLRGLYRGPDQEV